MATLPDLLKQMVELQGSDLHLSISSVPQTRVHGEMVKMNHPELTATETKSLSYSVLTDAQKKRFEETKELDFSFGIRGLARFRCNMFNQKGAVGAVYRTIPERIRPFDELGLPPVPTAGLGISSEYFVARADLVLDGIPFGYSSIVERRQGRLRVVARARGTL